MPKKKLSLEDDMNPETNIDLSTQTDSEVDINSEANPNDLQSGSLEDDSGQTDLEDEKNNDNDAAMDHAIENFEQNPDTSQTDPETVENHGLPGDQNSEGEALSKSNSLSEGQPVPPDNTTRQSRASGRRRGTEVPVLDAPIIAIDGERTVETIEDKLRNDILDLVESMKGRKILTGTIQGVERSDDKADMSYAVLYHGEFKVIIPATEAVLPPDDYRGRSPADVLHYMVTKRLGAEIDYIVKGVDPKTGIAAASRLEAMAQKRKDYYFGSDRDGNNLLYEGICAEARIVSVIRAGIFVDLFGLEVYIPLRELSYQRWLDADSHYQPGQRVLVKILGLYRSDRNNIKVAASVKQAGENPYEKALRKYAVGSRYVGTVSMVDTNGVFVSLDGGIDCLCSYPKRGRPPRGSRVTVRIIGINHQSNRIWGAITHMSSAR